MMRIRPDITAFNNVLCWDDPAKLEIVKPVYSAFNTINTKRDIDWKVFPIEVMKFEKFLFRLSRTESQFSAKKTSNAKFLGCGGDTVVAFLKSQNLEQILNSCLQILYIWPGRILLVGNTLNSKNQQLQFSFKSNLYMTKISLKFDCDKLKIVCENLKIVCEILKIARETLKIVCEKLAKRDPGSQVFSITDYEFNIIKLILNFCR